MDGNVGGFALDAYAQGTIVGTRLKGKGRCGDGSGDFRIAEKARFRIDDVALCVSGVATPVGVVIDAYPAIGLNVFQTLRLPLCKYKMLVAIRPHANAVIGIVAVEPNSVVAVGVKNIPVLFAADVPFQIVVHHAGYLRGIIVEGHGNCCWSSRGPSVVGQCTPTVDVHNHKDVAGGELANVNHIPRLGGQFPKKKCAKKAQG